MSLDGPPGARVDDLAEITEDFGTQRTPVGFLRLRALALRRIWPDGARSEPFHYDIVERSQLDAVVILLLRRGDAGVEVCLRSQLRVPLLLRDTQDIPDPGASRAVLWELPAGLVEPGEVGSAGVAHRARIETREETGYDVAAERFEPLGASVFPTPGLIAEKFHFVVAELFADDVPAPAEGDGHVLEQGSELRFVELSDALRACEAGTLQDAKTELGLRRLAARLEHTP